MRSENIKMLVLSALFCAFIAVSAQISFSFIPQVPFTLQNFAIALTPIILGRRYGTIAVLLYLLLGAVGAPIFVQFMAGFGIIVGKTGGYLIGYAVAVFVIGTMLKGRNITFFRAFLANIVGLIIIYALGVTQLKFVMHLPWTQAFGIGMGLFVIPDLVKIAVASYIGVLVRRRLASAGLLPASLRNDQIAV
ncbi:biotin transporter BioY [Aneurinibacillus aneurinilyticus]|jgi:biotin transport system substrate-specific component|uniref:Biotin transporter n=1 Tax=Aneurinibacillus aneurinilyticus ATCC 12856 TaxID=649747 RepID=U1YBJ4_ANEAE|nr:biotin transporter BioY [Aneurinibacillus aneurinilyticus]ERI08171.1 BioY family protein [Aneurinibacillus aneurinilyticus ATCC 12856]MCI1696787.1 biotin transporter BioY [Aneurinibacillus aneurinilyticus]MED0673768.1 biotin transporter BioY [Aneurinibacillus aneurinilyticus]MED0706200.1 biotin transporter BioY [Aneurinibacillus aneurinilyticus]MED0724590.1 biotin transporter BioY [Aneurinibacillus aneurinilyticus]